MKETCKIGLALGGGGARGLAHIPMLEVFDDLGIRPTQISGTSIGSVIGALYASGWSGAQIRALVADRFLSKSDSLADLFFKKKLFNTLKMFDLAWRRSGLLRGDKFLAFLYKQMQRETFEELDIPLSVVATDYWTREQVVLREGALLPAIKASMGLPGIFMPVELNGRVLIDGGTTNPVPYDLMLDDCDVVIAIDVLGNWEPKKKNTPGVFEAIISTFDILQSSIVREKLDKQKPTHYINVDLTNIDILSFDRSEEIYEQAQSSVIQLKDILKNGVKKETLGAPG